MKIAHIIPSLHKERCGIREYALSLTNRLNERNDVNVTILDADYSKWKEEIAFHSPNVVLIQHEYQFFVPERLFILKSFFPSIPFILDQHTVSEDVVYIDERLHENIHKCIVHSQKGYESSMHDNTYLFPLPCDDSEMNFIPPHIIRKSIKVEDEIVIGFFGMFYHHKGIFEIIKSLTEFKLLLPDLFLRLKLIVLSSFPSNLKNHYYVQQCQDLANVHKLDESNSLHFFTNYDPEQIVLSRLSACDAVFLPYQNYGGYAASSAFAFCTRAQVPIFTSDTCFFDTVPSSIRTLNSTVDIIDYFGKIIHGDENLLNSSRDVIKKYIEENSWKRYVDKFMEMCNE